MENTDIAKSNAFPDKMKINLHMFSSLILNMISGQVCGTNVIAVYNRCLGYRLMELEKKLAQPDRFCNTVGDSSIFSFST